MKKMLFALTLLCLCLSFSLAPAASSRLSSAASGNAIAAKDGDIIFQISPSSQSLAIQLATKSKYTHCGVIFEKNGKPYVYEAVQTVSWTPLDTWIQRGTGHHYVLMRLKTHDTALTPEAIVSLKKAATTFFGKPYDLRFQWSDEAIYCSELVWKIYERGIGLKLKPLRAMRDYDLNHAEVQQKIKERFGYELNLDEKVIAPSDLMESDLLKVVSKN